MKKIEKVFVSNARGKGERKEAFLMSHFGGKCRIEDNFATAQCSLYFGNKIDLKWICVSIARGSSFRGIITYAFSSTILCTHYLERNEKNCSQMMSSKDPS